MAAERGNKGCNKGENTPLSWRHLANNVKKYVSYCGCVSC